MLCLSVSFKPISLSCLVSSCILLTHIVSLYLQYQMLLKSIKVMCSCTPPFLHSTVMCLKVQIWSTLDLPVLNPLDIFLQLYTRLARLYPYNCCIAACCLFRIWDQLLLFTILQAFYMFSIFLPKVHVCLYILPILELLLFNSCIIEIVTSGQCRWWKLIVLC